MPPTEKPDTELELEDHILLDWKTLDFMMLYYPEGVDDSDGKYGIIEDDDWTAVQLKEIATTLLKECDPLLLQVETNDNFEDFRKTRAGFNVWLKRVSKEHDLGAEEVPRELNDIITNAKKFKKALEKAVKSPDQVKDIYEGAKHLCLEDYDRRKAKIEAILKGVESEINGWKTGKKGEQEAFAQFTRKIAEARKSVAEIDLQYNKVGKREEGAKRLAKLKEWVHSHIEGRRGRFGYKGGLGQYKQQKSKNGPVAEACLTDDLDMEFLRARSVWSHAQQIRDGLDPKAKDLTTEMTEMYVVALKTYDERYQRYKLEVERNRKIALIDREKALKAMAQVSTDGRAMYALVTNLKHRKGDFDLTDAKARTKFLEELKAKAENDAQRRIVKIQALIKDIGASIGDNPDPDDPVLAYYHDQLSEYEAELNTLDGLKYMNQESVARSLAQLKKDIKDTQALLRKHQKDSDNFEIHERVVHLTNLTDSAHVEKILGQKPSMRLDVKVPTQFESTPEEIHASAIGGIKPAPLMRRIATIVNTNFPDDEEDLSESDEDFVLRRAKTLNEVEQEIEAAKEEAMKSIGRTFSLTEVDQLNHKRWIKETTWTVGWKSASLIGKSAVVGTTHGIGAVLAGHSMAKDVLKIARVLAEHAESLERKKERLDPMLKQLALNIQRFTPDDKDRFDQFTQSPAAANNATFELAMKAALKAGIEYLGWVGDPPSFLVTSSDAAKLLMQYRGTLDDVWKQLTQLREKLETMLQKDDNQKKKLDANKFEALVEKIANLSLRHKSHQEHAVKALKLIKEFKLAAASPLAMGDVNVEAPFLGKMKIVTLVTQPVAISSNVVKAFVGDGYAGLILSAIT